MAFACSFLLTGIASAEDVTVTGANGAFGADGSTIGPGADGLAGSDGDSATATANANDNKNTAEATGGTGGWGGAGADGADDPINMTPTDGGDTGLAGSGGDATAVATNSNLAEADAQGGQGGAAWNAGGDGQYGGADGLGADGGRGGDADAQAIVDIGSSTAAFGASTEAIGGIGGARLGIQSTVGLTAGDGGDANAYSYARGSGSYQYLDRHAYARGGNGNGAGCCTGEFDYGGNGGNAVADSTVISLGNANISIHQSFAIGGDGGDGFLGGGLGGTAQATAWAESSTGKWVQALADQRQGNHGDILDGTPLTLGAIGIDSIMINNVGGSTTGDLQLGQMSQAGDGQNNKYGVAGDGGNAVNEITLVDTQASKLIINRNGGNPVGHRAYGGDGGNSEFQAGNGGDAALNLDLTSSGDILVGTYNVAAFGGQGGHALGDNDAGVGGDATLNIRGESTTGGKVEIYAGAAGGTAGDVYGTGASADGRDIVLNNSVQGFTTGELLMSQGASGGWGSTNRNGGLSGNGGDATSILSRTGSFTNLEITASASGGYGGAQGDYTQLGGDATAQAIAINNAGSATANAYATAGKDCPSGCSTDASTNSTATAFADTRNGGSDSTAYAEGKYGNATAWADTGNANATGEGSYLDVRAYSNSGNATATGGAGDFGSGYNSNVLAESVTGDAYATGKGYDMHSVARSQGGDAWADSSQTRIIAGITLSNTAAAETSGSNNRAHARLGAYNGSLSALAQDAANPIVRSSGTVTGGNRNVPTGVEAVIGADIKDRTTDKADRQAAGEGYEEFFAYVIADPTASSLQSLLAGNTEAMGKIDPFKALAAGRLEGGEFYNPYEYSSLFESSVDLQFDLGAGAHDVSFALFNVYSEGDGFDTLDFSLLIEGALLVDESFTDLASALLFFDDNASLFSGILVGADGLLDIQINFDIANSASGEVFSTDFAVASASVVPIPGAVWLMLSGLGLLGWFRKK